jgi:glycosyltransferase involved in cell wall biosynthesis
VSGRILFDVTGLIHWYAYFSHASGVQRVSEQLLCAPAIQQHPKVEFVSRVLGSDQFVSVDRWALAMLANPGKRRAAIARLRRCFAQTMALTTIEGLRRDGRYFHIPYVLLGGTRLDCLIEAWFAKSLPAAIARPAKIRDPSPTDVLFNPGDYWCHRTYVDDLVALRRRTGVRLVQMVHDVFAVDHPEWVHPGFVQEIVGQLEPLAPNVDRWITNSLFVSATLTAYLHRHTVPKRPITAIPMGWDSFERSRMTEEEAGAILDRYGLKRVPFLLHVGTLAPRKNLIGLFDALQHLRQKHGEGVPHCVLVGRNGWHSEEIHQRLRATQNEGGTVHWFNTVSDEELPAFYRRACFTVVPSYAEGWGLPVQESLAQGVPCIASAVGGIPEAGQEFITYFDPTQPKGLSEVLEPWIIDNAALAGARSQLSRLDIRRLPTWNMAAQNLVNELSRAITQD